MTRQACDKHDTLGWVSAGGARQTTTSVDDLTTAAAMLLAFVGGGMVERLIPVMIDLIRCFACIGHSFEWLVAFGAVE